MLSTLLVEGRQRILLESNLAIFSKSYEHIPFESGEILIHRVLLPIYKVTYF